MSTVRRVLLGIVVALLVIGMLGFTSPALAAPEAPSGQVRMVVPPTPVPPAPSEQPATVKLVSLPGAAPLSVPLAELAVVTGLGVVFVVVLGYRLALIRR